MTGTESFIAYLVGQAVVLILGYWGYRANRKSVAGVKSDVADVHTLVNNRSDQQDQRIEQLTGTLNTAGVDVPPNPASAAAERMTRPGSHAG